MRSWGEAYIVDAVRTPRARRKGCFSSVHPVDLLTYPLNELVRRNQIDPGQIEDVAIGCVTQCLEQAWCVGRAGVLASGWPFSVPGVTVNRLCGSGLQALNFVGQGIQSGTYDLAIAGGLEHMTRVPMFSDLGGAPSPLLAKHYPQLVNQGLAAEMLCAKFNLSRNELDEFSYQSHAKAARARAQKHFEKSLVPVPYTNEHGVQAVLDRDDAIRADTSLKALAELKPVFKERGLITAGNSSAIVDGAAGVLLASEKLITSESIKPRARIVAQVSIGSDPEIMLSANAEASRQVLKRAGLRAQDIDRWEINEAFAPVPLITIRELEIDPVKVNVDGGAIALGHPLGATGAMLAGTLLDELERNALRYGLVTMCIGLGMGIATIIERA
jgi:acetyl-CoA acyltransferase